MSKTKSESPAIEVGKPIKVDGATRAEVADKLRALRQQAEGMAAQGGFIEYDGGEGFSAVITFVKP
jgi:hypothetical protein